MLLIYVPRLTNRIGYTLNVLLNYIIKADYEITTNNDTFVQHVGAKLCYAPHKVGDGLFIRSSELMFQTTIEEQEIKCIDYHGVAALYPTHNAASDFPFDLLASAFFCLSRYEEYLPHYTDAHGRFPATESCTFKNGFLHVPVVDRWALLLVEKIAERYPDFTYSTPRFDYEDTIDIDSAYCYRRKGVLRTLVGIGKDIFIDNKSSEVRKRFRVLTKRQPDPFDTFEFIIDTHLQHPGIRLKFFPLMGDYNVYDKPISYQDNDFRQLLQHLCDYAKMGLHGSYASHDDPEKLAVESDRLADILHRRTVRNRYHFLRLTLPGSYTALIDNGILHDYTMGYADEPGFRAGTGTPYPFFDLESNSETPLTIHPFVVMDSTLYYYKHMSTDDAWPLYQQLLEATYDVGGTFCALWHNQSLCEDFGWQGWSQLYRQVIDYADQLKRGTDKERHETDTSAENSSTT